MKLSAEKSQGGVAFLGLVMVLFLTAGLFVASKMASNPDLSFFNISEKAATSKPEDESSCTGCADSKYAWIWDKKTEQCKKRYVKSCGASASGGSGAGIAQPGGTAEQAPCGSGGVDAKCFKKKSCGNLSEYSQKIDGKCPTTDQICCKKKS